MTRSVPVGDVRLLGDRALLVGVADPAAARALVPALEDALAQAGITGTEVVCGFATVAVLVCDPEADLGVARVAVVRALSQARPLGTEPGRPNHTVHVPCVFDGPDLDEVASVAGCARADVANLLTSRPLTVAVVGFSPGFAYLDGLPSTLARVTAPRPTAPGRRRRLGRLGQRPRGGVPDGLAGRLAPGRADLVSPSLADAASLRRARTGRHGPVHD